MIKIALWSPPYGRDYIEPQLIDPLVDAGIITDAQEDEIVAVTTGNWYEIVVKRDGWALYRLVDGFDRDDYKLAVETLKRRAAEAKRDRVLMALNGET